MRILENAIKDENKSKIQSHMNNLTARLPSRTSPQRRMVAEKQTTVSFELDTSRANTKKSFCSISASKPEQGDSFKVRFLGSMAVKSDKGNEYINETIRQVMATRAEQNVFKLSEYNLVVNVDALNLFKMPNVDQSTQSSLHNEEDLLAVQFDLTDLAFWSSHKDNERLFGFIIKEKNFKFLCHVFESDINSALICESITKATQLAYQLLVVRILFLNFSFLLNYFKLFF